MFWNVVLKYLGKLQPYFTNAIWTGRGTSWLHMNLWIKHVARIFRLYSYSVLLLQYILNNNNDNNNKQNTKSPVRSHEFDTDTPVVSIGWLAWFILMSGGGARALELKPEGSFLFFTHALLLCTKPLTSAPDSPGDMENGEGLFGGTRYFFVHLLK